MCDPSPLSATYRLNSFKASRPGSHLRCRCFWDTPTSSPWIAIGLVLRAVFRFSGSVMICGPSMFLSLRTWHQCQAEFILFIFSPRKRAYKGVFLVMILIAPCTSVIGHAHRTRASGDPRSFPTLRDPGL